jgi:hypothetical protein
VPVVGGPAAELLELIRRPAAKRQYTFLDDVAARLKQSEAEERLRTEDVVQSDAFISATVRVLDAARLVDFRPHDVSPVTMRLNTKRGSLRSRAMHDEEHDEERERVRLAPPAPVPPYPMERTAGDTGAAAARAVIGGIPVPFVGSAGAELFAWLVTPPLERRRDEWLRIVGESLNALAAARHLDFQQLRDNDDFLDVVVAATQSALRTRSEHKRTALRNAVLNAAVAIAGGMGPAAAERDLFIRIADSLSEWHFKIFMLFEDPVGYAGRRGLTFPSVVKWTFEQLLLFVFPELKDQRALYDTYWADLRHFQLVSGLLQGSSIEGSVPAPAISFFGRRFLAFITEP